MSGLKIIIFGLGLPLLVVSVFLIRHFGRQVVRYHSGRCTRCGYPLLPLCPECGKTAAASARGALGALCVSALPFVLGIVICIASLGIENRTLCSFAPPELLLVSLNITRADNVTIWEEMNRRARDVKIPQRVRPATARIAAVYLQSHSSTHEKRVIINMLFQLGLSGTEEVVPALAKALDDNSPRIAMRAAYTLQELDSIGGSLQITKDVIQKARTIFNVPNAMKEIGAFDYITELPDFSEEDEKLLREYELLFREPKK